MHRVGLPVVLAGAVMLSGCVVAPPSGPSVMALPGQGKSYDAFRQEDGYCRQTAAQDSGAAQTSANAQNNAVGSAVVGTALGAAAGALIGAAAGNAGAGAAIIPLELRGIPFKAQVSGGRVARTGGLIGRDDPHASGGRGGEASCNI